MKPLLLALAMFFVLPAGARGEEQTAIERPVVRPGDSWTYRRTDYETGESIVRQQQVMFANEHVIELVQNNDSGGETDITMTAEWNLVSSGNGGVYYPNSAILKFPLRVGDSWHAQYEVKFPRRGAFDVAHDREVKAAGWEEVTVPAGTFRALKVVSKGSFQHLDKSLAGSATEIVWYVPAVKRYVKWTYETRDFRGVLQSWAFELLKYQLHER